MSELPWSKQEIIHTVKGGYRPVDRDDPSTWAVFAIPSAFCALALGRPEGRAAPHIEDALTKRIARIWQAIHDGRDPEAAYDVPLSEELPFTPERQLSRSYRDTQRMLDQIDLDLKGHK